MRLPIRSAFTRTVPARPAARRRPRLTITTLEERAVPAAWGVGFTEPAPADVGGYGITGVHEPGGPDLLPPANVPPITVLANNIALEGVGGEPAFAPSDVVTGVGDDDCAIAATLAAEAASAGTVSVRLSAGGGNNFEFQLYDASLQPEWVPVPFDGTVTAADMRPGDGNETWAILGKIAHDIKTGGERILANVMRSIRGLIPEVYDPAAGSRADAQRILDALNAGKAVTTGTIDAVGHPTDTLDIRYGIVRDHAYTVLGIELPPTGTDGIWVTLRNPWGRDNKWQAYDLDGTGGRLDLAEWFAYKAGTDGTNDGIVRVPWAEFGQYFERVVIAGGPGTGRSINQPQQPNGRPVFANPNPGPFTIREGETLSVNLPATDPEGRALFYSVADGPGYVQVQTGAYSWLPTSNDLGRFSVTVKAETTYASDCNTVTFIVDVTSGRPRIQSLTASTYTVTDAGTDPITLTANGVVHDFDDVDFVEFFRDANGNGTLDPATDFEVGSDSSAAGGWNWNGQLTGVTPGNYKVFARAARYSFSDLFYSNVVDATIVVTAAPPVEQVAVKVGGETTVVTDAAGVRPIQVTKDAAGNTYVFYNRGGAARLVRYDPAGAVLAGEVTLVGANAVDVAMQPSGAFVVIWEESGTLYARRHSPDGTTPTGVVIPVSDTGVIGGSGGSTGYGRVAVNAGGRFVVTWVQGSYFSESVYHRRFQGDAALGAARIEYGPGQRVAAPGVAIDAAGNYLVGRSDYNFGLVAVRRYDPAGNYVYEAYVSGYTNHPGGDSGSVQLGFLPDDGFVAAWSNGSEVYARRVPRDEAYFYAHPVVRVNAVTTGTQDYPRLVVNPTGHFAVLWDSQGQDPGDGMFDWGTYGQVFGPDGQPLGPNFRVPTTTTSSQWLGGVAADAGLDFTASWGQLDPAVGRITGVRSQRFAVDLAPVVPPVPVAAVGRQAKRTVAVPAADPDGLAVAVTAIDGTAVAPGGSVTLPSGARVTRDPNGTLVYEAQGAVPVGTVDSFAYTVSDGTKATGGSLAFRIAPDLTATAVYPVAAGKPQVRFTELPANRATALQVTVKGVGPDGLLGTADDTTANVTPTWADTTLTLAGLADGLYRVTVDDALADETGRLLDGDGNGAAGGDFRRDFFVNAGAVTADASFNGGNPAITRVGTGNSYARAVAVQPDGKVVVAGHALQAGSTFLTDFTLARYLPGGALDPAFGSGGLVMLDFNGGPDEAAAVAVQPDGKILVAGWATTTNGDRAMGVARYLADGTPDPAFDGDGRAELDFSNLDDQAAGVVVQPDGTIVVAGTARRSNGTDVALVRLLADGTPDPTFDGDGRVLTANPGFYDLKVFRIGRMPDGRLVVAGGYSSVTLLTRYLPDGSPDPTFDGDGRASVNPYRAVEPAAMAVQPDGRIVLAGRTQAGEREAALFRVRADGSLDTGFGVDGAARVAPEVYYSAAEAVVVRPDGTIVAAGTAVNPSIGYVFSLFQFRPDGTPDPAFGSAGTVMYSNSIDNTAVALAVTPDGRFVVAGTGFDNGYRALAVQRSTPGGTAALVGPNGFAFDIDTAGPGAGQVTGTGLDALNALRVNGTDVAPPLAANGSDDGGRTVVTGAQTIAGLTVRREVTVPGGDGVGFARTVDAFTNAGGSSVTATVRYVSNLGLDGATAVFATSDGDTIPEPTDWWVATDDANGTGSPAVVHVLGGPRGLRPTSVQLVGDSLVWEYNLTVGAGQTARLGTFAIPATLRAQALAALDTVVTRTGFAGAGGAFLTQPELDSLANVVFLQRPTVVGTLDDVTAAEDAAPLTVPLRPAFADVEDGAAGLSYAVVSVTGTTGLVAGSVNPDTDELTLTPGSNAHGTATVTVRATDTDGLFVEQSFDVTLTPVADPPLMDVGRMLMLPTVAKNATTPPGVPVSTLLRHASNPDGSAASYGIAVTGLGGVAGRWEFTTSVGGLWSQISNVSDGAALLLPRTALVRFVPDRNLTGHAGIQFRAWDGTTGTAGTFVNVASTPMAFSAADVGWAPVGVTSPKFDSQGRAVTPALKEDTAGPGTVARTLLGLLATEFAAGSKLGLAVVGATGNGNWEVKVGTTWQPIADPSETAARLLKPTDLIRFKPTADWSGEATLTYRAWLVPTTSPLPTVGDVTADPAGYSVERLSAVATVTPVNDAPTLGLSVARVFDAPQGVVTLLQGAGDIDGDPVGIAVTRAAAKNGAWEYRLSAAATWTRVPAVSVARALLLGPAADLRFVPAAGATVGGGTLGYKVFDDSINVTSGARLAATSTAFSKATETGTAAFGNAAPTFKPGADPAFKPAARSRAGQAVSALLGRMTDTRGFFKGLAVTGTTGTGTWEFSLNGGRTWQTVGAVGAERLLLRSTDRLRFVPAAGSTGAATVSFAAWDRTTGVAGDRLAGANDSQSAEVLTAGMLVD